MKLRFVPGLPFSRWRKYGTQMLQKTFLLLSFLFIWRLIQSVMENNHNGRWSPLRDKLAPHTPGIILSHADSTAAAAAFPFFLISRLFSTFFFITFQSSVALHFLWRFHFARDPSRRARNCIFATYATAQSWLCGFASLRNLAWRFYGWVIHKPLKKLTANRPVRFLQMTETYFAFLTTLWHSVAVKRGREKKTSTFK